MSETKVVVPDAMIKAVRPTGYDRDVIEDILVAALRWLSENPIVPTDEQMMEFRKDWESDQWGKTQAGKGDFFAWCLTEWQRRMFRAAEPEVPESERSIIDAWLRKHQPRGSRVSLVGDTMAQELIDSLDAYRRGQRSK